MRRLVAPDGALFGLGLRLGARAAAELDQPQKLAEFAAWLERMGISGADGKLRDAARDSALFRHRLLTSSAG